MAEYYRILSYLYRYDKKIKTDCKGFVKAEQKRNGLKITLQIDDERLMEEMRLELCFYEKGPDKWKIRKLDTLSPARHHEETVRFYPVEQMPEAFDIKKQYGILLFYQDYFFYGSVWIGDEIPVEELLRAYPSALNPEYEPVQSPGSVPVPNPEPAPNPEHMPKAGRGSALEPESEWKPEPGWEPATEAEPKLQREPEPEPVSGSEPLFGAAIRLTGSSWAISARRPGSWRIISFWKKATPCIIIYWPEKSCMPGKNDIVSGYRVFMRIENGIWHSYISSLYFYL